MVPVTMAQKKPDAWDSPGAMIEDKRDAKLSSAVPHIWPFSSLISKRASALSKSTVMSTTTPSASFGKECGNFVMLSKLRVQTWPRLFKKIDLMRWMFVRRILESKTNPTPSAAPTHPCMMLYLYLWTPPTRSVLSKSMHNEDRVLPFKSLFRGPAWALAKTWPSSDSCPATKVELCHFEASYVCTSAAWCWSSSKEPVAPLVLALSDILRSLVPLHLWDCHRASTSSSFSPASNSRPDCRVILLLRDTFFGTCRRCHLFFALGSRPSSESSSQSSSLARAASSCHPQWRLSDMAR
mmetsp:Transcript_7042/g.17036  ORF Transcript_7042/g.17036 Transcript_7042/m.17036 type:complete len:296 (-) Transcript_7042:265-1152(-)